MQGMEVWKQINESARIVVWPGVVALALVLFRTKLGEVAQRLREADTPVGTMRFDPSNQLNANRGIAETGGALVETLRAELAGAAPSEEDEEPGTDAEPPVLQDVEADVDAVIRASFAAGFELSRLFQTNDVHIDEGRSPAPVIEWESGAPRVTGYEMYVPDYTPLRTSLEQALEHAERSATVLPALDGVLAHLEELLEKAQREGDSQEEASLRRALDEGRDLRDRTSSALERVRESQEKLINARVVVPVRRWMKN